MGSSQFDTRTGDVPYTGSCYVHSICIFIYELLTNELVTMTCIHRFAGTQLVTSGSRDVAGTRHSTSSRTREVPHTGTCYLHIFCIFV